MEGANCFSKGSIIHVSAIVFVVTSHYNDRWSSDFLSLPKIHEMGLKWSTLGQNDCDEMKMRTHKGSHSVPCCPKMIKSATKVAKTAQNH